MAIRLTDVTGSPSTPLLHASGGRLLDANGQVPIQTFNLAHWELRGLATPTLSAVAYLMAVDNKQSGRTDWFAEIVFLDAKSGLHAPWKTLRVHFPDGQYQGAKHDAVLKDMLRQELV
jgi:hypothetical protein